MQHCGKLKSTHPGKLRQPQIMDCGSRNARDAIHKMDHYMSWIAACALRQLQCMISFSLSLSSIFHFSQYATFLIFRFIYLRQLPSNFAAAIHEVECSSAHGLQLVHWAAAIHELPQSTRCNDPSRRLRQLVNCISAAVGVDVPQYKSFYTVPKTRHV